MGQKVHPGGMRVGVIHDWKSNWYTGNKEFAAAILEDGDQLIMWARRSVAVSTTTSSRSTSSRPGRGPRPT